jgi:UDP-N-acetylglucosamine diphosphorylase / glucose-1-phosphate thymidylyltransferase / UDP-N-acetylgalactosamine diphosphorylase / glucosamine-1-phosphate N-acetyltransferase / galactosamine-1-phosphate N-acetyltransferase
LKAIIMVAGKSTRTYPLTLTRPKPLLKVVNKPILAWHLDALRHVIDEALLVVGYRKEMIREAFGDDYEGMPLRYVEQSEQLGTGHAVLQCEKHVDGPFIAMNGDDLYAPEDLQKLAHATNAALAKRVANPKLYGVLELDSQGRVQRLVEKPDEPASDLASVGAYSLTPEIFEVLRETQPSERGEIEITSAIQMLAQRSAFHAVEMERYWLPIAYPWNVLEANEYLLQEMEPTIEGEVSPRAELNGPVHVGKGSVIRGGVVIDGPVYIGENCTVGPNSWLRPGATLYNGCRVGQSCEIKNTILFDGAAVPHLSYAGDTIVGERSNFGAGTITANVRHDGDNVKSMIKGALVDTGRRKLGAIIGDGVHTGINTCLYPGRKLWPGTSTRPGETVLRDIESSE